MNSQQIKQQIEQLQTELAPKLKSLESLRRQLDDALSREWVAVNGATRAATWHPDHDTGNQWFGTIWSFAEWIKAQPTRRRFLCWNGTIYFTDEVLAGRADHNLPGRWEDLQ